MPVLTKEKQIERIKYLIEILEQGEEVHKRDFDNALPKKLLGIYEAEWREQQDLRKIKVPLIVKEYEKKLQQALMWAGRAEQYNDRKTKVGTIVVDRKAKQAAMSNKADSLFEDALERLQEILSTDESLRIWFDRDIHFEFGNDLSIDATGMPRLITSRSLDNVSRHGLAERFGIRDKAAIKLDVLKQALVQLQAKPKTAKEIASEVKQAKANANKLQDLMAKLKTSSNKW